MLATGTILERDHPWRVVNPLARSIDSSGKKRLILDQRYVNMYLHKDKIKFDVIKCSENYLLANKGYLFKFDLKNSYHHFDIFDYQQTYLSISWVIKGATKYFVFTALPFGLSFAPFVFTKVVRSLVKHWRCKNCLFSWWWFRYSIHISSFIKVVFVIEDVPKYIKLGNYKESLIGSDQFLGSFIAF